MASLQDWGKIVTSFGKDGIPMPFVKEIFLIECAIVGTGYVNGIEERAANIVKGTLLSFHRELQNPFDELAILILNGKNEKLGYVPRAKNEVPARLMDGAKLLFGRVEYKDTKGDWIYIHVNVYMRDL